MAKLLVGISRSFKRVPCRSTKSLFDDAGKSSLPRSLFGCHSDVKREECSQGESNTVNLLMIAIAGCVMGLAEIEGAEASSSLFTFAI